MKSALQNYSLIGTDMIFGISGRRPNQLLIDRPSMCVYIPSILGAVHKMTCVPLSALRAFAYFVTEPLINSSAPGSVAKSFFSALRIMLQWRTHVSAK